MSNLYDEQKKCVDNIYNLIQDLPKMGMDQDLLIIECMRKYAVSTKAITSILERFVKVKMIKIEDDLITKV